MVLTTVLNSYGNETVGWPDIYKSDPEFGSTYQTLLEGKQVLNFYLQDALLCHLGHICVPSSEHAKIIWEAHYIQVSRYFEAKKIMVVL